MSDGTPAQPVASTHAADPGSANGGMAAMKRLLETLMPVLAPAIVGAISALGVAYVGGLFAVQKESAVQRGSRELEQQKFSYELIRKALNEAKDVDKANALLFLADIGLLSQLNVEKVKAYAEREKVRLKEEPDSPTLLPRLGAERLDYPSYNLPMPETGGTKAGRELLGVALAELNRGVHEERDRERVREYWAALGAGSDSLATSNAAWSGAFLSWAIKQAGNPARFPMSATNAAHWNHAVSAKLTFLPGAQAPAPGDIAFWLRPGAVGDLGKSMKQARAGSGPVMPMHAAIVYAGDGTRFSAIGGNVRDAVRLGNYDGNQHTLVGFVRLPDAAPR
jgi:hypothetical protein